MPKLIKKVTKKVTKKVIGIIFVVVIDTYININGIQISRLKQGITLIIYTHFLIYL